MPRLSIAVSLSGGEHAAGATDAMNGALPNFIIIGAMKCGTSTLHEQLARQPSIFLSEPKEPNFFSNDDVYARGESWYRKHFDGTTAALRGESSTHYTKLPTYPKTIARMRALLPDLKLIYVMRHPLERLVSHYIHEWSVATINDPIDRALERHRELLDYGCYYMQLAPYLEAYGRQRILPVFLEHMQLEPQAALERVCRFLGYSGPVHWRDSVARQNASSERLRLGPWARAAYNHPVLEHLRRMLVPRGWREALKARLTMRERPVLSARSRDRAVARFDRDLEQLGGELGVALSCATFTERVSAAPLEWVESARVRAA